MGFFFLSLFPILTISWDVNSLQKGNDRINDGYQKVAKLFFQSKTVIGSLGAQKRLSGFLLVEEIDSQNFVLWRDKTN